MHYLKEISRIQANWLIQNKKLSTYRYVCDGKWITSYNELTIINRNKKSKRKKYRLQENLYKKYFSKGIFTDKDGKLIY